MKKILQLLTLTTLTTLLTTSLSTAPIHDAAERGNTAEVERLLADGASVDAQDIDGWTPLHWAARDGHTKTVRCLIDRGADINAKTIYDRTPLHIAVVHDRTEIVRLLISYGADLNAQTDRGLTPLDKAGYGYMEIVELLARAALRNKSLWNAAHNNHLATAKKALRKGAQSNAIEPNSQTGDTPMHVAVWNNNIEMVKWLLGFGGKANIKNNAGKTAMDLIVERGEFAFLPIFLEAAIVETAAEPKYRQDLIKQLHKLVDALPRQQPGQLVPTEQRAGIEEFLNSLGRVND